MEWREATTQMNKTPNTMKMDLGQNILEISPLSFFEAKASWVYTRLAHWKMPKSRRVHTLIYKIASNLKKSLTIFIFIPLSSNKNVYFSFCSFLFIFLFLDAQKCLTSRVLMTSPWASKSVKQIDDAFSICAIAASPKGANASFKSDCILVSSLQGQVYH